ncbi:hypothetical protein L6452_43830 [Arctium lappa]|uniref:Uncharacterized protein n=1 Tax=Arctium lappa TaxID=4217 RepID=A0ACB8XE41_ARCLA|nr:hypothetical protein L6452_43830 [Arctium lappa]
MSSREALAIGTDVKTPVLFKGEYEQWKDRFLGFIDWNDLGDYIRLSLKEGVMKNPTKILSTEGENEKESKSRQIERSFILQGIPNEIYAKIDSYNAIGKQMWDQLEKMMLGSKIGNQLKVSNFLNNYEEFKAKEGESLEGTYDSFVTLLNELSMNKVKKSQIELNLKFLSILQPEWKRFTRQMKQMKDLNEIPLHEVYEIIRKNEEKVDEIKEKKKKTKKAITDPIALVVKKKSVSLKKKKKVIVSESEEAESDENTDSDDCENLKQAMLMLTKAFQKTGKIQNQPSVITVENSDTLQKTAESRKSETPSTTRTRCSWPSNKMLLAKQQEVGKALMAEDEFWLDHSEEEEEKEEKAHMFFMGKTEIEAEAESDEEDTVEVSDMTESDFLNEIHAMMIKLQELESKLKREKGINKEHNQSILKLSKDIAE